MEQTEEDSLNIPMLSPTSTKQDSLNWYGYQAYQKRKSGEADSAIHYLKEVIRLRLAYSSRTYAHLAQIYQEKQMNDSAIHYYFHALQKDTTRSAYFYCGRVLGLLHSLKEYDLAKQYIQGLRKQMKRSDIPYINLIEGDLWMELHQPDSAMKHYLIASETGNDFITSVAYERLALLMEEKRTLDAALDKHIQSIEVKNNLKYDYAHEHDTRDFEALKLKNELNELKVKQQSYIILILGLGTLILLLCGSFTIYLLHRKRKHLMQENLLLKQQEELSTLREKEALLREKDARMREELFRRIRIVKDLEEGNRVHITDEDWKDIHVMLESTYPGFLANLRENFPALSEKELNFCCLVKMSMSLQQLADIYCISINSVSRRKLRLKEKLGIGKEDSLSKFLNRFA
jgi:DNA-binding CsgD family transcriptional regulator